jgi:hypothetical protein
MSTVPNAKAALLALMQAWVWPGNQPSIRWGGPTEGEDFPPGGELIYFGDTEATNDNYRLGVTAWDEAYSLRIIIDVIAYGDIEQGPEERCWELYGHLVQILMGNKTLSGTVSYLDAEQPRAVRQTNVPLPNQWLSRLIVDQPYVAVVTP